MNVIKFPIATTDIFPLANSSKGGQLLSEFNIKSRDGVSTDPDIKYIVGHSFTHSMDDFAISAHTDSVGAVISSSAIKIAPGVAIVDGHFVRSLSDIVIDIAELNSQIAADQTHTLNGGNKLKGKLVVGLKVEYSTEATTNGSMLVENSEGYYEGIQVVVQNESDFKLPEDVPTDRSAVTAHLRLGTFTYQNGAVLVNTIVNDPLRIQFLDSSRIKDAEKYLDESYVTKRGLDPNKFYVFAGKGSDNPPQAGWCDATGNLIDWPGTIKLLDENPQVTTQFVAGVDGVIRFIGARKHIDGSSKYFEPVVMPLPVADYGNGTPGTVNAEYTNHIKAVAEKISNFYNLTSGKQRAYFSYFPVEGKSGREDSLPPIGSIWNIGDYILVRQDDTVDSGSGPATIYVVIPGIVRQVMQVSYHPPGVELDHVTGTEDPASLIEFTATDASSGYSYYSLVTSEEAPPDWESNYRHYYEVIEVGNLTTISSLQHPETYEANKYYWRASGVRGYGIDTFYPQTINISNYRGIRGKDYFTYQKVDEDGQPIGSPVYYIVSRADAYSYSDPVILTGYQQLATQDSIGGFYDASESDLDRGYVKLTEDGRLQLIDYALLRSGTLAYQLGQNYTIDGTNLSAEEIQNSLNEYINNRIVFPNETQIANAYPTGSNPNIITLTLTLPKFDQPTELYIQGIDSRFGAFLDLIILGESDENTVLNIVDCEKLKIDSNIGGTPKVNVYRCGLYYDAGVLDTLNLMEDISLWYQKFATTDPDITVNGMTVEAVGDPIVIEGLDIWNANANYINDIHYNYGLKSITFNSSGFIIGAGIYINCNTTANINQTAAGLLTQDFVLPQGQGLTYPESRLTSRIKITGEFVTVYKPVSGDWILIDSRFTADADSSTTGQIVIYFTTQEIASVYGDLSTEDNPMSPGTFHIFYGGILGGNS